MSGHYLLVVQPMKTSDDAEIDWRSDEWSACRSRYQNILITTILCVNCASMLHCIYKCSQALIASLQDRTRHYIWKATQCWGSKGKLLMERDAGLSNVVSWPTKESDWCNTQHSPCPFHHQGWVYWLIETDDCHHLWPTEEHNLATCSLGREFNGYFVHSVAQKVPKL